MKTLDENGANISGETRGKRMAVLVCWILGNGSLFPWNSIVTAQDYYLTLFPNYHPTRVVTIIYIPIALATSTFLTYKEATINTRKRNIIGYILFFISSITLPILDLATSGKGGIFAYLGVCGSVAIFGFAEGMVEGGIIGDLSLMCPEFLQSFLAGMSASGAITSSLRFITKAAFENSKNGLRIGALMFLSISTLFELTCGLLYAFVFPKLPIVKYYRSKAALEGSKTVEADLVAGGIELQPTKKGDDNDKDNGKDYVKMERLSNKQLLVQNFDYAIISFLIYALTLSIFPGFLSEDTGKHNLGSWYSLILVATYNLSELIARYVPIIKGLKLESRKGLMVATVSRFLLVPAFYFTGGQGWTIMLTSILGFTNGYLTVCVFTTAPQGYKGPEKNALGNLLTIFVFLGLFIGVSLDWLWLIGKRW